MDYWVIDELDKQRECERKREGHKGRNNLGRNEEKGLTNKKDARKQTSVTSRFWRRMCTIYVCVRQQSLL